MGEPALALVQSSTPTFSEFDPTCIPYQDQVISDILCSYDYSMGAHEVLLSGSVGSAKTILLAHLAVRHCAENPGARVLIGRKALPDLKRTLYRKIQDHMHGSFRAGIDFHETASIANIRFRNGSEIIAASWADRSYMKVRSLDLSMALIEELTENDDEDRQAYEEIKMRVGRIPHVKQNIIASATNPDSPSHWAYEHFELIKDEGIDCGITHLGLGPHGDRKPTKHVYYSVTEDNPFLPISYREQLRRDLDPKMYLRMGKGRWIEIKSDGIYHQYDRATNYRKAKYDVQLGLPVILAWDFNIGEGKPMSVAVMQYHPFQDTFHIFGEVVIEGMRTEQACEELQGKGFLDLGCPVVVHGDAAGRHKDTRNIRSDYDIIEKYLVNYRDQSGRSLRVSMDVPVANPPVRTRHNTVNAYCRNDLGQHRLFVYEAAPTVDKGLRLTKLKDSGLYIEDDSKDYQHITTAVGYALSSTKIRLQRQPQRQVQL